MPTPLPDFWNDPPEPWFKSIARFQWQVKLEHARAVVDAVCKVLDEGRGIAASDWALITIGPDAQVQVPQGWGSGSPETSAKEPLNELLHSLLSDNDFNSRHDPHEWRKFFATKPRRRDWVIPPIHADSPEVEEDPEPQADIPLQPPLPDSEGKSESEAEPLIETPPPEVPVQAVIIEPPLPKPRRKPLLPSWTKWLLLVIVMGVILTGLMTQRRAWFSQGTAQKPPSSGMPDLGVIAPPDLKSSGLAPSAVIPSPEPGAPKGTLSATWQEDAKGGGRLLLTRDSRTAALDFRAVEDAEYKPRGARESVKIPRAYLAVRKLSEGLWNFILDGGGGSAQPRTNVSWIEAQHLCKTLGAAFSQSGLVKVRLPWQWEWEKAASTQEGAGFTDLFTGKGEWMEDAWQENNRVWPGLDVTDDRGSGKRVIRGGSSKDYVLHTTFKDDAGKQLVDGGIRLCMDPSP